jgi:DNA replication protein DnaC
MRYKEAKLEDLNKEILDARETAIVENKGVFIYGDTGTGKTHSLHALSRDRSVVDNFVSLLSEFRDYMQKGFYFDKIKEYTNQEYVFIDDIGAEKTSEFVIEFLYVLVNKRYENMKRTVFATNLSLEDFQERYGDRIISRISEMCILVELKGGDKRLN